MNGMSCKDTFCRGCEACRDAPPSPGIRETRESKPALAPPPAGPVAAGHSTRPKRADLKRGRTRLPARSSATQLTPKEAATGNQTNKRLQMQEQYGSHTGQILAHVPTMRLGDSTSELFKSPLPRQLGPRHLEVHSFHVPLDSFQGLAKLGGAQLRARTCGILLEKQTHGHITPSELKAPAKQNTQSTSSKPLAASWRSCCRDLTGLGAQSSS